MNEKFINDTAKLKQNLKAMGYDVKHEEDAEGHTRMYVSLHTHDEVDFTVSFSARDLSNWNLVDVRETLCYVVMTMNHLLKGYAVKTNKRMVKRISLDEGSLF